MNDVAIRIKGLSVHLGGRTILHDVNATIRCKETTAIIGPNGAGKTTLLLAIMGLVPYTGTIEFCEYKRSSIGYVPQKLDIERGTPITVKDFLALSTQRLPLWLGDRVTDKSLSLLERVGARHLLNRPLGKLSGGELQRVLLSMALQNDPDILLLDEPVAGVDIAGEELFSELLCDLQSEKELTLVLVSHDLSMVTKHANHVICLNRTVRCEGRTVEVLTQENLERIYGIHKGIYEHKGNGSCQLSDGGIDAGDL